ERLSDSDPLGCDVGPFSWSTGLTNEYFDHEVVGLKVEPGSDRCCTNSDGSSQRRDDGSSQNRTGNWYFEAR
ncbi:Hypothetical predicted protein, partial [Olea europaea subsp. europaea]